MFANAFIAQSRQPTEKQLSAELGAAKTTWDALLAALSQEHAIAETEWHSYSPKAGWSLRLKHKKRNIVYLSPGHGYFLASFALGDKAMEVARKTDFPKPVIQLIRNAKRYAEGSAIRIEVRTVADIDTVKKLTAIKLAN
jgi:3-methyladenine DNA glycosylase Mpg